jgi:hypothetical protein
MFDPRAVETVANNLTVDLVFDGKLPFQLPGGKIGWAMGAQGRSSESRVALRSVLDYSLQEKDRCMRRRSGGRHERCGLVSKWTRPMDTAYAGVSYRSPGRKE